MLILLALLFLIGLVVLTAASKTAIGGEKKKSALVDLKTDLLARLNASEELMSRHKSSDFFEPLEIRKPRVPPEEFFEPDPLIDIDEAPVLDANAMCRLTGLPINECDCENCSLFRKSKR